MQPYLHKVQYYETDKMGITHHSNYIRWMEEARVDFSTKSAGALQSWKNLGSPRRSLRYDAAINNPTRFSDQIRIFVALKSYRGVRMTISYRMEEPDGTLVCEGETDHCFINTSGQPVRLRRDLPQFDAALTALLAPDQNKFSSAYRRISLHVIKRKAGGR